LFIRFQLLYAHVFGSNADKHERRSTGSLDEITRFMFGLTRKEVFDDKLVAPTLVFETRSAQNLVT